MSINTCGLEWRKERFDKALTDCVVTKTMLGKLLDVKVWKGEEGIV